MNRPHHPFQDAPDPWQFTELVEGRPDLLVPTNGMGRIYSREEWDVLKARVDAFYATFDDGTIQQRSREEVARFLAQCFHPTFADVTPHPKSTAGYIYLIHSEAGYHKIGKARDPFSRSQTIGTEHAVATRLIYIARCTDYTVTERLLHRALAEYRMNGEWFNLPAGQLDWLLSGNWVDDLGLRAVVTDCERVP